jgi:hypothetical protein
MGGTPQHDLVAGSEEDESIETYGMNGAGGVSGASPELPTLCRY